MTNRFDEILDDCINRITFKGETGESCVKRYPEHAAELEQYLYTVAKVAHIYTFTPSSAAKEQARRRLMTERQAITQGRQERRGEGIWRRWHFGRLPRWAMAGATATLVILVGVASVVAASTNTLPGDVLYPVKRTTEQTSLSLQLSPDGKAKLYLEHGERRANEMAALITEGKTAQLAQLEEDLRQNLALATNTLGEITEEQAKVSLEAQARQSATQALGNLQVALQKAPEASRQVASGSFQAASQAYGKALETAAAQLPQQATTAVGGTTPLRETRIDLSSTLVPNVELDAYAYAQQQNPTKIPKEIIGDAAKPAFWASLLTNLAPGESAKRFFLDLFARMPIIGISSDLTVESLALWGVFRENDSAIGGALTFASAAETADVRAQIPSQAKIWATVSDRTLYFVSGSGAAAERLKAAISQKDFKYYNDQAALQEVAQLPNSGTTKLAAVAVVKPNKSLVQLVRKYSDNRISSMMDSLLTWGGIQVIAVGLCAPQQIEVAEITQKLVLGTIWGSDLGIVASVKSGLPGFLVSPAAGKFLENAGYAKVNVGGLTLYKGSLKAGSGRTIPVLFSLEGNRIFAAASVKESYGESLITRVNR